MTINTRIEWTDDSFNPWIGCQKVSPGCDACYAKNNADHRFHLVQWGPHGARKRTSSVTWKIPLRLAERARADGKRRRMFCASWADVFDNQVPAEWRTDPFNLIRVTPELDWQLLTKRPENIRRMLPPDWDDGWPHVWLGATAEDQEHFDRRWPILRLIPVRVRFISYEPALGPLRIAGEKLPDWIICGGESGAHARMMDPAWARSLRDECAALGVAFFMKQMTKKAPIPSDLFIRQFPSAGLTGAAS
jgi:protein gp37